MIMKTFRGEERLIVRGTNDIALPLFALLSTILCIMLALGVELGIVTKEGYMNCNEILVPVAPNVYQNVCTDFIRPDLEVRGR